MSSLKDTEFDSIENTQMKTCLNKSDGCIWHSGFQEPDFPLRPQPAKWKNILERWTRWVRGAGMSSLASPGSFPNRKWLRGLRWK